MPDPAPLPPFAAIVVAAGKGLRAGQAVPKQFAHWRGKPVVRHSVEALLEAGATRVIVAIPPDGDEAARAALEGLTGIELVSGGEERQTSVANALEKLSATSCENVLIHDAARPVLPRTIIARLLAALAGYPGAIPVLPVIDSLALDADGLMAGAADRESLRRVQTPQAFRFADILAAHRQWNADHFAGDDAQVLRAAGGEVVLVAGDEKLAKLTYAEDFMTDLPAIRTGMGLDVHQLAAGEELWLGGIRIEHDKGLAGHSDADVGLHALVDAILGAIGAGDIGSHFPPSDPQWKGASSDRFLVHAVGLAHEAGYGIGNVDLTLICEAPKIGPHRAAMQARIAELLGVDIGLVSVKATTTERLGFAGRGEGIAAQAIATLIRE
ncbi:bifunctional 2-C-methyl-D-erythritol 4-phosphate cytidylyltransferase/2-C-methyl-D-erythritol 2,4-cyclodiphosphate synthase [Erythrobacter sp. QSSC1-22B]|uniref:bifunctional 2-C-methyl-D-erythritol 4-phosphate cytidylyltransferase/2-C-methyl-D-erythritol 2,4-cyclodiphosphate synthase n=1 Tax=Erythrobacter sp. QSSC1-22B TaxID=1860125 RepID=UPI0008048230|nr:bifunctional 2-C-methyl-D-erythritol 4-phosphate cytidylyltransferase/2-C-methyl-D-erythritol 2,4-cyclodiphosphate synthase [Erythrobacter sp. QSSC1-22B]OBX20264.1 bifunctional 2-C-methyl-D-erythritol 4-phosphate cytidylyltransferase/2-C-methyl-D-erythritol 2,4-cyclodiphosphate synthase [Erythrobacter sp. QSSC1-22B]